MIEYCTIDIEAGDGQIPSIEQTAYLASEHARESTRLINELIVNTSTPGSQERVKAFLFAERHAQASLAYGQLAAALVQAERAGQAWVS